MIEDLEEGAAAPSRRAHVVVAFFLLVVVCVVGWAAVSSQVFRGPYATPDPSGGVTFSVRFTPAPFTVPQPAAVSGPGGLGCVVPGGTSVSYIFVNGELVTVTRPSATSKTPLCAAFYLSLQQSLVPIDRRAR